MVGSRVTCVGLNIVYIQEKSGQTLLKKELLRSTRIVKVHFPRKRQVALNDRIISIQRLPQLRTNDPAEAIDNAQLCVLFFVTIQLVARFMT